MKFALVTAVLASAVFAGVFLWPAPGDVSTAGTVVAAEDAGTPGWLAEGDRFTCTVTKVHDGDGPIWCAEGPKVRLTAVAARELDETCSRGHPCPEATGAEAQQALERLALGEILTCEKTGTSYNRTTAWCWRPDGVEINCAMVEGGWALRWDRYDPEQRLCS